MSLTNVSTDQSGYDSRFGYVDKGTFRAAYGNEAAVLILTAVIAFILYLSIGFAIYLPLYQYDVIFAALTCLIPLVLLIFAVAFVFKNVLKGKQCSYCADSIKLLIGYSGRKEAFFYDKVLDVRFTPFSTLGRERGYDVSVLTREDSFQIRIITKKQPKDTPFYILIQRNEEMRKQTEKPITPLTEEEAKRPEAPQLYSRLEENSAASGLSETNPVEQPKITPINTENKLLSKGTFRSPFRYEKTIILIETVLAALLIPSAILLISMINPPSPTDFLVGGGLDIICIIFLLLVYGTAVNVTLWGSERHYEAMEKEFVITDKKGTECIYMCDVTEVLYKPYKRLWIEAGYRVLITTKYKTSEYICLFRRSRKFVPTNDTPFYIIEQQSGLAEKYTPFYKRTSE